MSEFLTFFPNPRNFSHKCPLQTEVSCIHKCAKWTVELKLKSIDLYQNSRLEATAITSRNLKESFCRLLMLKNDTINPPTFSYFKTSYGSPYISDIENIRPSIPVDLSICQPSQLNTEFFTFFIEIDLEKTYKSESSKFRKIEADFERLDYEIYLNANIHNSRLLTKDFFAKLDTFKIIQSIQLRIKSYKELMKNNKFISKNEFFVRILDQDINMGILFSIPDDTNLDFLQNNPLNLMNSQIIINKIYVEVVVPVSLFFKTPQHPSQVKEQINTLVNNYKKNNVETSKNVTELIKNNKKILNNLKNSMISPKIKNEMSQIIFSQLSNPTSNSITKTSLTTSLKCNKSHELHESPSSKGENMRVNQGKSTVNIKSNSNTQNFLSFNKYDNMQKPLLNNQNSSPIPSFNSSKINLNEGYSINPPNFINYQPSSFCPQRSAFNNINYYTNYNMSCQGGMKNVPFIDTKMLFNRMKDYFYAFYNEIKFCPRRILQSKERLGSNLSNFQIFMTNSTPLNLETEDTSVKNFFTLFEKSSILGLDIILKNSGTNILTNYEPSLSSLHIELSNTYFNNNSIVSNKSSRTFEPLNSTFCPTSQTTHSSNNNSISSTSQNHNKQYYNSNSSESNINKLNDLSSSCHSNSSFSVDNISVMSTEENSNDLFKLYSFMKKYPGICFTEDQPLHNRANFQDKIKEIFSLHPEYENLILNDITDNSYFSVLWTPIKSTKKFVNTASFLVFYRFRNKYLSNAVKYVPVIGLLTNKFEEEFWLTNTNIISNPECLTETAFGKVIEDFSKNKYRYNQVLEFCHKFVKNNKITNNIDYNYFLNH